MTPTTPDLRPEDFVANYNLPDSLDATIPTRHQPGEPGIHWVARGLMVETCAQLLGRPISVDLHDHPNTAFIQALISLASTVLSTEPLDDRATVELVVAKQDSR